MQADLVVDEVQLPDVLRVVLDRLLELRLRVRARVAVDARLLELVLQLGVVRVGLVELGQLAARRGLADRIPLPVELVELLLDLDVPGVRRLVALELGVLLDALLLDRDHLLRVVDALEHLLLAQPGRRLRELPLQARDEHLRAAQVELHLLEQVLVLVQALVVGVLRPGTVPAGDRLRGRDAVLPVDLRQRILLALELRLERRDRLVGARLLVGDAVAVAVEHVLLPVVAQRAEELHRPAHVDVRVLQRDEAAGRVRRLVRADLEVVAHVADEVVPLAPPERQVDRVLQLLEHLADALERADLVGRVLGLLAGRGEAHRPHLDLRRDQELLRDEHRQRRAQREDDQRGQEQLPAPAREDLEELGQLALGLDLDGHVPR